MNKPRLRGWSQLLIGLSLASEVSACAPYLTKKDLHVMNPSAEIIDVCVRTPTVDDATYAWGYRSARDETISVTHRAAFEEFAPRAEVFYWYDPLAPSDSPERLPWPA